MIKRYREDQRATQRELAAAAGMSVGALRDLEQGRTRSPRWGTVEELAGALGLDPAQRTELIHAWRDDCARASRQPRPAERWPGVRINVLGPLTAWRDGMEVALGSVRQRAVLGLMALQASACVHRDSIIDLLWGEHPPSSAVAEVQGYVSRLRRMLGDGTARTGNAELVTTAGGCCYRLNAALGQLDLALFGELTRQARAAAGAQIWRWRASGTSTPSGSGAVMWWSMSTCCVATPPRSSQTAGARKRCSSSPRRRPRPGNAPGSCRTCGTCAPRSR
jgi:transcriptional regulator with XRE-family HTH domain/DNA-binding winged helix-turn-helix (wHTH) protein